MTFLIVDSCTDRLSRLVADEQKAVKIISARWWNTLSVPHMSCRVDAVSAELNSKRFVCRTVNAL